MLTWRLWREINRPTPLTALYYRLHIRRTFIEQAGFSFIALSVFRAFALTVLPVLFIFLGVPLLFISYTTLLPYTALLIPLANTCYGLAHCVSVSAQLVRERELATYDLLCVSPPGRIGLHWAYTVSWLFSHRTFRWLLLVFIGIGMFAALLGIAGNLIIVPTPFTGEPPLNLSRLLEAIANIVSFWLDYVQTVILSSLIAMNIAGFTSQVSTARFLSGGAFLTLQVTIYVVSHAISLYFQTALLSIELTRTVEYQIGTALITVVSLVITYLIRESVIWLLWDSIVRTLNASPSELDTLIRRKL